MDLADVMDEIATVVNTISGLRTFAWPPGTVSPPAAIVSYPEDYTYDLTYGRGFDHMTLPLVVVVGKPTERTARDQLAAYVKGSGSSSIKQVIETATHTSFDTAVVKDVDFDVVTIGGGDYLAATFTIDIAGRGA